MKSWCPECPYSPGEVTRNIDAVSMWRERVNVRQCLQWQAPPSKALKWNVDGSAKGKPGRAGIGGVLHDDKGTKIAEFAASVGIMHSNEAKLLAIVFSLELLLDRLSILTGKPIIESDSKNALSWKTNLGECPWNLRFYSNKLKNMLLVMKDIEFIHVLREANHEADRLAKEGSSISGRRVVWFLNWYLLVCAVFVCRCFLSCVVCQALLSWLF